MNLDFKNFIEGRSWMPVGGAFGKTGAKPQGKPTKIDPFDDRAEYGTRIKQGKTIEEEICNKLTEEIGWVIKPSSAQQDKYEGIDGWIVSIDGGKTTCQHIPIQIKARKNSSGNDILWETVKPWRQDLNFDEKVMYTGKDMKCKAVYLVSVGNNGSTVRIRQVSEIIQKAKEMTEQLIQNFRATGKKFAQTQWGEARVVKDPSQQANFNLRGDVFKINCFIKPEVCTWKQDVTLKNPIGQF